MFKCKYCGKEYSDKNALGGHVSNCILNPTRRTNLGKTYKKYIRKSVRRSETRDDLFCKYCNKQCKNLNSLKQHELRCKNNAERRAYNNLGKWSSNNLKGQTKDTCKSIYKQSESLKNSIRNGIFDNANWGLQADGNYIANYSHTACKYIDYLNASMGWNLQHAENGGEIVICGYFLDGYDKDLNIAFEFDEPRHYIDVDKNILRDKDIHRMISIKNKLGCRFFRYNQKLDLLYEWFDGGMVK